jgi:hypothetical protein
MRDYLGQDGLSFVAKSIIGCKVTMSRQLQRLGQLPLEIDRERHRHLIPCEAGMEQCSDFGYVVIATGSHILCRHLKLILSQRVKSAESDIRVGDAMLPRWKEFKVITFLENSAVACRNVQAEVWEKSRVRRRWDETRRVQSGYNIFLLIVRSRNHAFHLDLMCPLISHI